MGYESRVYAMNRVELECRNGSKVPIGCEVARFEVFAWSYSDMVDSWTSLFNAPVDYDLPDEGADGWRTDCYGIECRAADVETVREWLKRFFSLRTKIDEWPRAWAFLCWLDAIRGTECADGLQLVEWGH